MGATGEQAGEAASTDCASRQAFPLKGGAAAFLPELHCDFCFASCRHSKLNFTVLALK